VKLWCTGKVYYINLTNTSCNCIASIAILNNFNAAGALLWYEVGDIIKNTESGMAVNELSKRRALKADIMELSEDGGSWIE
jgi:hypothetical protein